MHAQNLHAPWWLVINLAPRATSQFSQKLERNTRPSPMARPRQRTSGCQSTFQVNSQYAPRLLRSRTRELLYYVRVETTLLHQLAGSCLLAASSRNGPRVQECGSARAQQSYLLPTQSLSTRMHARHGVTSSLDAVLEEKATHLLLFLLSCSLHCYRVWSD